jgi:hypothetical protein
MPEVEVRMPDEEVLALARRYRSSAGGITGVFEDGKREGVA